MSLCTPCAQTEDIPACLTNLIIGTITTFNAAVFVYVKNLTTDAAPIQFSATSSGAGLVTIDVSSVDFMPEHAYEAWITLATATSIKTTETVTIGGTGFDCASVRFTYVNDTADARITFANQTLTLK